KAEDKTTDRKNLVIFLTSHIIASAAEADELYRQKSELMEELQKKPEEQPAEEPAEAEEVTEVEESGK
ncbi:MAG: hypothetical protein PVH49_15485, partial [Syntrophobacterales bacterium]